jgi:polar amino acid transport system permease protein
MYLEGLSLTLQIAVVAVIIGVVLGIAVAMVKTSAQGSKNPILRFFNVICTAYTTVIRGTPQMIQLLILYGISAIPNGVIACFIGFGINSGAYVSETFRSGIQSVDGGQMEAARSLGLTRWQAMTSVVLPQAVKNVLPAIFNEFIMLIKDTSIAGYIAVNDLTKNTNSIRGRTYDSTSLFIAAGIYLILTYILTQILKRLERRFRKSDRN